MAAEAKDEDANLLPLITDLCLIHRLEGKSLSANGGGGMRRQQQHGVVLPPMATKLPMQPPAIASKPRQEGNHWPGTKPPLGKEKSFKSLPHALNYPLFSPQPAQSNWSRRSGRTRLATPSAGCTRTASTASTRAGC